MSEKASTAFILSLIGGIFVVLGGLLWAAVGTLLTVFLGLGFLLYAFLIFGIIILIGAIMINSNPVSTKTWGIVIIVLGVCALPGVTTTFGGLLAIVGGALAVTWRSEVEMGRSVPPPPSYAASFCPTCGSPLKFIQQYQRWYCDREGKYV